MGFSGSCSVQFTTTSPALAEGVFELLVSLGYRVGVARKQVRGRTAASSTAYNLNFTTDDDVFRLSRKALLHTERRPKTFNRRGSRFLTAVRALAPGYDVCTLMTLYSSVGNWRNPTRPAAAVGVAS